MQFEIFGKTKNMARVAIFLFFSLFLSNLNVYGQVWGYLYGFVDLRDYELKVNEAGNDFQYALSTAENDGLYLDIYTFGNGWNHWYKGNTEWSISAKKVDYGWHKDLKVYIRRTGQQSELSGGTSYINLTNTNKSFFAGRGNSFNIPLQVKVDNISTTIPSGFYCVYIIFTLFED